MQGTEFVAPRHRLIRCARISQGLFAQVHHQRVELAVVAVHPVQVVPQQRLAADLLATYLGGKLRGGEKRDLGHGGCSKLRVGGVG